MIVGRRPKAKTDEFGDVDTLGTPVLRYKLFVLFIIKADRSILNTLAPFGSRTPRSTRRGTKHNRRRLRMTLVRGPVA